MSILKWQRGVWLLAIFCLTGQAWAEFVAKPGKLGFAYPFDCRATSQSRTNYHPQTCTGFRLDYVEYNTNIVVAYEEYYQKFSDSFIKEYRAKSWGIGYRIEFGSVIDYFWQKKIAVLSSLHLTIVGFAGSENKTLVTRDYKFVRKGNYSLFEIGWRINDLWDIFVYGASDTLSDFYVPGPDVFQNENLSISAIFFGVHYSFP